MTTTIPSLMLTPIACPDWCGQQDGHPDDVVAEDRVCVNAGRRTYLKLYPQVAMMGGGYHPQYLDVHVERTSERGTYICIDQSESETEWRLTPDEAAHVRDALNAQLDAIAGRGAHISLDTPMDKVAELEPGEFVAFHTRLCAEMPTRCPDRYESDGHGGSVYIGRRPTDDAERNEPAAESLRNRS